MKISSALKKEQVHLLLFFFLNGSTFNKIIIPILLIKSNSYFISKNRKSYLIDLSIIIHKITK